jgi:hypothetical protein
MRLAALSLTNAGQSGCARWRSRSGAVFFYGLVAGLLAFVL